VVVCSDGYITRLGCVRYGMLYSAWVRTILPTGSVLHLRTGAAVLDAGVLLELAGGLSAMLRRPVHTATSLTGDGVKKTVRENLDDDILA
jgi:hypothetical protein